MARLCFFLPPNKSPRPQNRLTQKRMCLFRSHPISRNSQLRRADCPYFHRDWPYFNRHHLCFNIRRSISMNPYLNHIPKSCYYHYYHRSISLFFIRIYVFLFILLYRLIGHRINKIPKGIRIYLLIIGKFLFLFIVTIITKFSLLYMNELQAAIVPFLHVWSGK